MIGRPSLELGRLNVTRWSISKRVSSSTLMSRLLGSSIVITVPPDSDIHRIGCTALHPPILRRILRTEGDSSALQDRLAGSALCGRCDPLVMSALFPRLLDGVGEA